MDDLEQAIPLASDSLIVVATAPVVRVEALAFCSCTRDESPLSSLLCLCLSDLAPSLHVQVHFWCLQSLHDALLHRCFPLLMDSLLHQLLLPFLQLLEDVDEVPDL
jgi:exportin-T